MSITTIIRDKIRESGPISFRDFMEMALYYPGEGYYNSPREKIGKSGDFYTSTYLSSLFGQLLGKQFEQMWIWLGKKEFTIVEIGAGRGMLCHDILHYLKDNTDLYSQLNYWIVEKSSAMVAKQKNLLGEKVRWFNSVGELPPVTGCIFSNEVVDNFAVHQVIMQNQLKEVYVDHQDGFIEVLVPASNSLLEYFEELNVRLPEGFRTEINLEAVRWMKELSHALDKGFVMTIDYGFPSPDLYSDQRRTGTIVCYHRHKINYSPYQNVGEQDITTHINFSALQHWGKLYGLEFSGYTNQAYFLQGLGITQQLSAMERNGFNTDDEGGKTLMLQTFLRDMGTKMKVLVQHKGIERAPLSGLQFSQRL